MQRQAGFTLIETLASVAIGAIVLWLLLVCANRLVAWSAAADARVNAQGNAAHLFERLTADAASAQSIAANGGGEIDFVAEDGAHRTYTWSYVFDTADGTVTRSSGDTYGNIDAFAVSAVSVADLLTPGNAAYDPLFAGASAPDVPGDQMVAIAITASGVARNLLLASPDAPTAFTVVAQYTPSPTPIVTPTPVPLSMTTP
jgi:prepilin-type N-terminal cleavage/methylation domain-containing protein